MPPAVFSWGGGISYILVAQPEVAYIVDDEALTHDKLVVRSWLPRPGHWFKFQVSPLGDGHVPNLVMVDYPVYLTEEEVARLKKYKREE